MHAHRFAFPGEHTPRLQGVSGLFESYIGERVVPLILPIRNKPFPSTILSLSLSLVRFYFYSPTSSTILTFTRQRGFFFPLERDLIEGDY